jgi:hypothetical protein
MFPFIRPLNIHPPASGGGAPATGRCCYCDNLCGVTSFKCSSGKTNAECAALHTSCNGFAYVWDSGASCPCVASINCDIGV